jgi:hypothetical protein
VTKIQADELVAALKRLGHEAYRAEVARHSNGHVVQAGDRLLTEVEHGQRFLEELKGASA